MRYLITGGLGHIGSKLIRHLSYNEQAELVIYDDLRTQRYCSVFNLPKKNILKLYTKDVTLIDAKEFQSLEIDIIIHLAATTDAEGTATKPELIFDNNLLMTKKIVYLAEKFAIPIIFISSTSVYGSQENEVDENSKNLNPQSPYALCKVEEENIIMKSEIPNFAILRFGTIFGFSEGMRFHTAVNKFCWQAGNGLPITVWETAKNQLRPYLGINDAVYAIEFFSNLLLEKKQIKDIFNVVTMNYSVNDILRFIEKAVGNKLKINYVSSPIMNQYSFRVNTEKVNRIGFDSKDNLEIEIAKVIEILSGLVK